MVEGLRWERARNPSLVSDLRHEHGEYALNTLAQPDTVANNTESQVANLCEAKRGRERGAVGHCSAQRRSNMVNSPGSQRVVAPSQPDLCNVGACSGFENGATSRGAF